jgi:drug/metabolite transporter (DMT)-like permease
MKGTLERLDVNSFLAWRFTIATLFLIAIRPSVLKKIDLPFLKKGVILGAFLSSGYIFQSFGACRLGAIQASFLRTRRSEDLQPVLWRVR